MFVKTSGRRIALIAMLLLMSADISDRACVAAGGSLGTVVITSFSGEEDIVEVQCGACSLYLPTVVLLLEKGHFQRIFLDRSTVYRFRTCATLSNFRTIIRVKQSSR